MRSGIFGSLLAQSNSFAKRQDGAAIVFLAVALVVLVAAAGLAFDSGRGYLVKARLTQAVDAAALAGGRSLALAPEKYEAQIRKYLRANLPQSYMGIDLEEPSIQVVRDGNADEVTVKASAVLPTTLMKVMSVDDMNVSASSTVRREVRSQEVALVLDNSLSMAGSKIDSLRQATDLLLEIVYGDDEVVENLYFSVVPFTGRVNLAGAEKNFLPLTLPEPRDDPSWENTHVCLNTRRAPYHTSEAAPDESASSGFQHYTMWWSDEGLSAPEKYLSNICPEAAMLPLEASKSNIVDRLDEMTALGCTRYDIGASWGWRALSENWQGHWRSDTDPKDYGLPDNKKIIIIMTDGANEPGCTDDFQPSFIDKYGILISNDDAKDTDEFKAWDDEVENNIWLTREETEERFAEICDGMRQRDIIIYTITFEVTDLDTKSRFESCASGSGGGYFDASDEVMLINAFATIGTNLTTIRVTH